MPHGWALPNNSARNGGCLTKLNPAHLRGGAESVPATKWRHVKARHASAGRLGVSPSESPSADGTGFVSAGIFWSGLNRVENTANEGGHFRSRLHFFIASPNWRGRSHAANIIASKTSGANVIFLSDIIATPADQGSGWLRRRKLARKWDEHNCSNSTPPARTFTESGTGVFLLLQSAGNSIHWKVTRACRGRRALGIPSLRVDSVLPSISLRLVQPPGTAR